jgi:hypothetical protein
MKDPGKDPGNRDQEEEILIDQAKDVSADQELEVLTGPGQGLVEDVIQMDILTEALSEVEEEAEGIFDKICRK